MLYPILNPIDKNFQMYQGFVIRQDILKNFEEQLNTDSISEEEFEEKRISLIGMSTDELIEKYSDEFKDSENSIYLPAQEIPKNKIIMYEDDEYELLEV